MTVANQRGDQRALDLLQAGVNSLGLNLNYTDPVEQEYEEAILAASTIEDQFELATGLTQHRRTYKT